jgi:nucleotide-binding universal stress UspA family protein
MDEILVPVDGSSESMHALEYAFDLFPERSIRVAHVLEVDQIPDQTGETAFEYAADRADEVLADAESVAADNDREIATVRLTGNAGKAIVDYAEENPVDHIVMGSTGRTGVRRVLFGSVAETVTRRAPVPVTIVR